jgi:hypothetical protein
MMGKGLISNLFGLAQKGPLPVWTYRLRGKENAIKKHVRSLLNSACLRLLNKYGKPSFYDRETIISLVDIGDSFETDDYILEKQVFIPKYFLSSPEAWDTFINSFANLLMRYGKNVEKVSKGIVRKYILDIEFINQSAYLKIDFEYMLFFPEDLDIQLEKGGDPEIGGKYYTPNGSTAILKNWIEVSKEEYKKLRDQMIPVASEETKVKWNEGFERVNKRGYGYVAEVVFNENDGKKYLYPANALKRCGI